MSKNSSHQISLNEIKGQARRLANQRNISKGLALEILAQQNHFPTWQDFRIHILKYGRPLPSKILLKEFDSRIHNSSQIIGISPNENGGVRLQSKTRYLSVFDKEFLDIKEMRSYFDQEIKEIISQSSDCAVIFLLIHFNSNVSYPPADLDGFLRSLVHQYPKITYIELGETAVSPTAEDQINWIDDFQFRLSASMGSQK